MPPFSPKSLEFVQGKGALLLGDRFCLDDDIFIRTITAVFAVVVRYAVLHYIAIDENLRIAQYKDFSNDAIVACSFADPVGRAFHFSNSDFFP